MYLLKLITGTVGRNKSASAYEEVFSWAMNLSNKSFFFNAIQSGKQTNIWPFQEVYCLKDLSWQKQPLAFEAN